jgi:4-alpha-glucanotransferase
VHARRRIPDLRDWGVEPAYRGDDGRWHEAPPSTIQAIGAAFGADGAVRAGRHDPSPVRVVGDGDDVSLPGPWELTLEDGTSVAAQGRLPSGLPCGYHQLRRETDGQTVRLIVSPLRCRLPSRPRAWGWAVQLPALRSQRSWGIGDLADLRSTAQWSAGQGGSTVLVSPLHASRPGVPQQASPYFPSSRCWHNPLYLRIEDVPGADDADLQQLAVAARALNEQRLVQRDRVWELKLAALERLWERFGGDPDFDRYCDKEGPILSRYATFCALSEAHAGAWPQWPGGVRHPEGAGVSPFASRHRRRVRFHQWLQWLLDRQLASAGAAVDLVQDLAVGVDPNGADAWMWQDVLAPGMAIGAPPDAFNRLGQDWGLPPFDPWKLRAAGYEPFARTLRANLRGGGGLRVDHVMGLFRQYWVPHEADPGQGAYVRYPSDDLLGILALESDRAGAFVVGEDLGTVEPFVREELASRNVLSSRVLWFEEERPADFPARSMASISTHDLPTVAGLWTGADLSAQQRLGLEPDAAAVDAIRARLRALLGLSDDASLEEVIVSAHRLLAEAASMVVTASLEDALGVEERPNMPGTTDAWPNWSLALPVPLESALSDPRVVAVADTMRSQRGRAAGRSRRGRGRRGPV